MTKMNTTVVGSFPLANTPANFEMAFLDQVASGITIPCYPQLVDMNHQILEPLSKLVPGLKLVGKEYYLSGGFVPPKDTVATEYGKQVQEILKKHPDVKKHIAGTKACLTGPFTLCSNIIIDDPGLKGKYKPMLFRETRAHQVPEIVEAMADYIARITKTYVDMGFTIVSIDDPFLSQMVGRRKILFHERPFILKILNAAAKSLAKQGSLHVCGVLSPLLRDLLLESSIHHLDHEFKTAPQNIEIFDKQMLVDHGKVLAFGSLQTNPVPMPGKKPDDVVESVDDIAKHLKVAKDRYGAENILVKPDCGFGGMNAFDRAYGQGVGQDIVKKKMKAMTIAVKQIFGE
jgi:methionine synthase II (cobalamin-independent)